MDCNIDLLKDHFHACRKLLTAIGDESRHLIITVLAGGECTGLRVGDITEQTHLSRPAVSHHLKILLDAEVVGMNKDGTKHLYYLKLGGEWPTLVSLVKNIEQLREEYMREVEAK